MKAAFVVFVVLAVVALKVNADLRVHCTGDVPINKTEFHPHPCECDTYYVCLGLEPIPMPCPKGLHWNRIDNKCDFPNRAKCRPEPECPK